ncbi:MAG TPA: ribonuclease III [candidate division Zixibacteria bacterium]|nr:ribonuclease III [candidate division Zixibacteria bacterium]
MATPSLQGLGQRLGIELRDPEAIRRAFVHSSYYNENPHLIGGHNERLEFLGDAVLGLVVSRLLYERFPDDDEGSLTARRAAIVNRDALAALALRLGLDRYLLLGRGEAEAGGARRPSLLAAAMEAVVGAVYLAEGLDATREWLTRLLADQLTPDGGEGPLKSAKSRLQEWTQRRHHTKPSYEVLETVGPAHDQTFTVAAVVDGRRLGVGVGSSRQRAEERAAAEALASLEDAER